MGSREDFESLLLLLFIMFYNGGAEGPSCADRNGLAVAGVGAEPWDAESDGIQGIVSRWP